MRRLILKYHLNDYRSIYAVAVRYLGRTTGPAVGSGEI